MQHNTISVPIQQLDHNASRVKENSQGVRPLQKIHINRKTTPSGPGILTIRPNTPNPTETLRSQDPWNPNLNELSAGMGSVSKD